MVNNIVEKKDRKDEHEDLFFKEVFALKNDLYYQFFENENSRWFFDISYKPHQTLSGDCYSIRKVGKDKIFIFLVDAMGKGLNASITSIMSATFLNYIVDTQQKKDRFYLEYTIKKYIDYIKSTIFDDEIISASFILFDFKNCILESSIFGMPPVLIQNRDHSLIRIKANNLPISKYNSKVDIVKNSLKDANKLLIYSDGLNETAVDKNHIYRDYMDEDFIKASNYKDFLETAQKRVGTFDDDMTMLYIEKERCHTCRVESFSIESYQDKLELAMSRVEKFLIKYGLQPKDEAYMSNAFMEMLLNAYEHGSLQISHNEKREHLEKGTFDDLLLEREDIFGNKNIKIDMHIKDDNNIKTFKIEILDEGDGFDTHIMKNKFSKNKFYNGRGLVMTSKMVDAFYYNSKGNKVILEKFQKRSDKDG